MDVTLQWKRVFTPTADDISDVMTVCRSTPAYWRLTEGRLPDQAEVCGWFGLDNLPQGFTLADAFNFIIYCEQEVIGFCQILRGWRYPEQSTIGLLLVVESWQGRGVGRQIYQQIEALVRDWPGMEWIRAGVIATNLPAFPFWYRMGFVDTGERRQELQFLAETVILEKRL
ncbi:GNAT family N-acetyltransferase [Parachitinimonas caeni]|uniref:GNAT family N-acetyltransferase n=1 Tax=Parachitinimonas caeni TaxID=3031301 RepID=A0ABT7DQX9_9NEIS|nr:GNAT family N-acetyltransferase [Parachitinimonas caeni]MDK2122473.1 GNAT family N-acetyltransferase [Parachitinimonas caeni]